MNRPDPRKESALGRRDATGRGRRPASTSDNRRGSYSSVRTGPGRALVAVYAIFALAATARASYQLYSDFATAPLAYILSAFSAVVYIVATVCLVRASRLSHHIAVISCAVEFVGVIVVGLLSIIEPEDFQQPSVWSLFGIGYGFVPLVLPVLGLLWLRHIGRRVVAETGSAP